MVRRIIIALVGFLSLIGVLWYLGYFGMQTGLESQVSQTREYAEAPTAASWALFDVESGIILKGKNHLDVRPIASITKLFTAYAAVASDSLERETWIILRDIYTEGRSGKLQHGEHLTVRDLLFPLLIESSNDAGTAIGGVLLEEHSESVDELLSELGLEETTIVDTTGLSPRNVSSAKGLAVFFSYLYREHPYITDITQLRMYIDEKRGLINNNPARELRSFRGGKHGYLPEANRTFVGAFERSDGSTVGIVLLGSEDILTDLGTLFARADTL